MAQAKSNSGPLMTTTSTTSTQCEYPLSRGDANSKRARKIFLDGRIRALEQVARRCLHVHSGTDVHIEHLEQYSTGDEIETKHSFSVTVLDEQYHFSVKVNAEHGHDIASQVAAMDCIRQQTDVFRVPKVIAHDASDDNELGRAWIAREYIPGVKLCDKWRALSMDKKRSITRDLARYSAQLYRIRFDRIGSLVYENGEVDPSPAVRQSLACWSVCLDLGYYLWLWLSWTCVAVVNLLTPVNQRTAAASPSLDTSSKIIVGRYSFLTYPGLPTGPFTNARDWFLAQLQQTIHNTLVYAEICGNCINIERAVIQQSVRWSEYLRQRPNLRTGERSTTVYHPVRDSSILISDDGQVAGLLNWDNISVCPLWAVTAIPDALQSTESEMAMTFDEFTKSRSTWFSPADHATILEAYAKSTAHVSITGSDLNDPTRYPHYPYNIAGHICSYFEQLETCEKTQMRQVFLTTMSGLAPEWVTVHSKRKMDTTIGIRVRDLMNGSIRYLDDFKEEFDDGPHWTDDLSERSWPSDDDTAYEGSDVDDD